MRTLIACSRIITIYMHDNAVIRPESSLQKIKGPHPQLYLPTQQEPNSNRNLSLVPVPWTLIQIIQAAIK